MLCFPIHDPYAYLYLEELLAHLLFRTDVAAKKLFVEEYVKSVADVAASVGNVIDQVKLAGGLDCIIDALDHYRVQSLWQRLYEGSYARMREREHEAAIPFVSQAHDDVLTFSCLLGTSVPVPPGPMDRYRAAILSAYDQVQGMDYAMTLTVAKRLVIALVSELVQGSQKPPIQPDLVEQPDQTSPKASQKPQDGPKSPDEGQGGPDTHKPPGGLPERAGALQELVESLGDPALVRSHVSTRVEQGRFSERSTSKTRTIVNQALNVDAGGRDALESAFTRARERTARQVDHVRTALTKPTPADGLLRRDTPAKVVFRDVRDPVGKVEPLSGDDRRTISRLRALFASVMGRRVTELDDTGFNLDVPAYIERRTARQSLPCFETDVVGQGFKVLLLLDRSDSMQAEKKAQAERACRVLRRALDYPFVDLHVWGFQSVEQGQVDITRFARDADAFDTEQLPTGGMTPLHVALQVAAKFLEPGESSKHLIALTDGYPTYKRRDGQSIGLGQLMTFVRDTARRNRRCGVGTYGVMVGFERQEKLYYDTSEKQLQFMFGNRRFWRQVAPSRLGRDLVRFVADLFLAHLANA
jgi:hypothetical protein